MGSHGVTLPPELHDQIIDHLFDDKTALELCTRVCHDWRVTSQFHLFRAITVRHPTTLESFLELLDRSPHLTSLIRDLVLCGSLCKLDAHIPITTHALAACLFKLPALQSLRLDTVWWTDTGHVLPYTSHAPALRELTFRNLFTTPTALFTTICAFRAIRTLHIEGIFWNFCPGDPALAEHLNVTASDSDSNSDSRDGVDRRRPTLEHLIIGPGSAYNLLRCVLPLLQTRTDVSTLRTLDLDLERCDAWPELRGFMQHVSAHLDTLSLNLEQCALVNECESSALSVRVPAPDS
jgi:hypothetical protein